MNPQKKRVLIVEEDSGMQEILCELMEEEGFEVQLARDPFAGLSLLRASRPAELILVDMAAAVDNPLLHTVREDERLAGIPVIAMGAEERRPRGVSGYLLKPFELSAFFAAVRPHCG